MGFQPRGDHSATDRVENAPQERFEKERRSLRDNRAYDLVYEDWHETAFSVMCD